MIPALLDGLVVVDLGRWHAGPYCAKLFADAGADVIHVEQPGGDPLRSCDVAEGDDYSPAFAFLNAGKRSVTLDYSTEKGAALLWELLDRADIVVENSRPGTLERYGFSTEEMQRRNPALVRVSISNFGQTGPLRDAPASEMTLQAASGLMDGNGELQREPLRYPMNMAQHWTGANAAYAALVAVWRAQMGLGGQHVDVSIQESLANTWYLVYADYQYTGALQARGQRDLLPAADGQVMVRWQTSVPWEEFAIAMDALELVTDPVLQPPSILNVNAGPYLDTLETHTPSRTRREWMDRAIAAEVPVGMMQSLEDIQECRQLETRQFWDTLETPAGERVQFPGKFYRENGEPAPHIERQVPALGEHNEAVFAGMLGHSATELEALRTAGVI